MEMRVWRCRHVPCGCRGRSCPSDEAALVGAARALDVVDVVGQGDEEVEEELAAAVEHLHLHGAAALEGGAAADDESQVVGTQLGVVVGGVGIRIPRREQDGVALDAGAWIVSYACESQGSTVSQVRCVWV